jgi:TerC family integral membrane protein
MVVCHVVSPATYACRMPMSRCHRGMQAGVSPNCETRRTCHRKRGCFVSRAKRDGGDADVELITELEVIEPEVERDAEQALLSVGAAALFGAGVWGVLGPSKGEEFFAGYLLEQSLSIDNLFVFVLVFSQFQTPVPSQKVVLSYGIATAAVLRLVLILLGADAVEKWKPILLVFSGILLFSSIKLLIAKEEEEEADLSNNKVVQFSKSLFDFTDQYDGDKFFTMEEGGVKTMATPLLLVLLIIELSDVIFAVDSIPAVFGVTLDPFIVYTSNMFAILSLRGLYGFVSNVLTKLVYLEKRYVQLLAPRTAHSHSFLALACSAASLWFWDSSVERF